jgi:hypothetical protein
MEVALSVSCGRIITEKTGNFESTSLSHSSPETAVQSEQGCRGRTVISRVPATKRVVGVFNWLGRTVIVHSFDSHSRHWDSLPGTQKLGRKWKEASLRSSSSRIASTILSLSFLSTRAARYRFQRREDYPHTLSSNTRPFPFS